MAAWAAGAWSAQAWAGTVWATNTVPAEPGQAWSSIAWFSQAWAEGAWAFNGAPPPEPPPAATVTPSGGYPAYERLLDERAKRRRKATDDEDRIGEAPVPLVAPVADDATAKPKRSPNALREARRALANPLAREPDSAARQEAMQAQALKVQQAADLAQAVAELAAARLYARQRDDEEALILLLQ